MSSEIPSTRAVRSVFAPAYLNGSTAIQNPSSARAAPESAAARARAVELVTGALWDSLRQVAELVADIARRLHAVARLFFQAAPDDAC